jgi:hypothetical protein
MIRRAIVWTAAVSFLLLDGCNRRQSGGPVLEPLLPDEASVGFELEPLQAGDGSQWIGTYASQGKIARFRVGFGPAKTIPGKTATDFDIKTGDGRFIPEAGSDSTVLLADLQKALQAKTHPVPAPTKTSVPFTYANLGDNLSQARGGGFNTTPPGNWTALKLFLGQGEQEAEVFLNINLKTKKGQFSMKDPDYGDLALVELAKVL